jgi:GTP-binding protein
MLIDHAIIHVRSGKGGDGHVSFARFKYVPKGGPDGGNGGDGGSVFLVADAGVDTLLDFSGRHDWPGHDGEPGQAKQAAGRDGENLDILVAPGTLVFDNDTGELLADLDAVGKRICVAKGGRGGFGNEHFKSPTHQAPRSASAGEPAQERNLRLELKLIADAGIIGKPNAGKSTLLARVSRATPKIAAYPFTTLTPILGIAELTGARRMVLADIPGLIEGAHQGHGLGTQFLRHIERTRLLLHLLEVEPADGSDPIANYHVIRHELASYSPALAAKPELILLSKMDLLDPAAARAAADRIGQTLGKPLLLISAATGAGLTDALESCWRVLQQAKAI